jgi:hypothetical protein
MKGSDDEAHLHCPPRTELKLERHDHCRPSMNMAAAPGHPDLREFIRAGDTVMWGQAHAQPLSLIEALVHQRHSIGRTRLLLGIGHGLESVLRPEHADAFDFLSYCAAGSNRGLARSGVLDSCLSTTRRWRTGFVTDRSG